MSWAREQADPDDFESSGSDVDPREPQETWAAPPFRVLAVAKRDTVLAPLVQELEAVAELLVASVEPGTTKVASAPADIALVYLGGDDLGALSWSLRMREALGTPEVVFIAADSTDPVAAGLSEFGIRSILPVVEARAWLLAEGPALARLARARRLFEAAQARVYGSSRPPPHAGSPSTALFEAERRFRESYIRSLLALSPTRHEAARRAGVSYRTLSHILYKLGLTDIAESIKD
jgi:hypothetical protein